MSFALGKNMDPGVTAQINALQTILNNKTAGGFNSEVAAYYFNAKTPWIKLTSAIEFDSGSRGDAVRNFFGTDGNQLAQANVLFNLDPKQEIPDAARAADLAYRRMRGLSPDDTIDLPAGSEYSSYYGIRPKPGITGMSIQTHNRFGSLRTATVNFVCWDPKQLAIMELLYMRPGYSVILEFGHSVNLSKREIGTFIDNDPPEGSIEWEYARDQSVGNTDKSTILYDVDVVADVAEYQVKDTTLGINFFGSDSTISTAEDVYKEINTKRQENNYAYDGIYGIVKNFNWSLRPDGGYNCMTSIVSKGELIESLKIDLSLPTQEVNIDWNAFAANQVNFSSNEAQEALLRGETPQVTDPTAADEAFKQELIAAGVFGPANVNAAEKTFQITFLGVRNKMPYEDNASAVQVSSFQNIIPSPYGSQTRITVTFKWVK